MTPESSDGVTDQAKEKAQEVAGQASEQAQQLAGQAQSRVRDQVDQRSTQAGERVSSTADDLRGVGEELRNRGNEPAANVAEQAASRVEQLGSYLEDSDGAKILSDLEDLARRQPLLTLAGGAVLGLAAARFLKASSSERYSQQLGQSSTSRSGSGLEGTFPGDGAQRQAEPAAPIKTGTAPRELIRTGTASGNPASS